eukprot:scaffold64190_cov32-Tisochrysis_lutea.AAC.3
MKRSQSQQLFAGSARCSGPRALPNCSALFAVALDLHRPFATFCNSPTYDCQTRLPTCVPPGRRSSPPRHPFPPHPQNSKYACARALPTPRAQTQTSRNCLAKTESRPWAVPQCARLHCNSISPSFRLCGWRAS